jgi:hypothetical protein
MLCLLAALAFSVNIMPLGDSITVGPNGQSCWRAKLWQKLKAAGVTDIDFVGSVKEASCEGEYDPDTEGQAAIGVSGLANDNLLPGWLRAAQPDIVLLHLGTNDIAYGIAEYGLTMTAIEEGYQRLLNQFRTYRSTIHVLVAQIIPIERTNACPDCARDVVALNNFLAQFVQRHSTEQSSLTIVDQHTGFNVATDTTDGVHPNDAGHEKIATKWLAPLEAVIRQVEAGGAGGGGGGGVPGGGGGGGRP